MTLSSELPLKHVADRLATAILAPSRFAVRGRHGASAVPPQYRAAARNLRGYRDSDPGDGLCVVRRHDHYRHRSDADMVEHASTKPGMARVTWQRADPAALPFPDATFGIVACHFGVVAMPDRVRTVPGSTAGHETGRPVRLQRAGTIRHNPVADCLQDALDALFPSRSARVRGTWSAWLRRQRSDR